jgi:CDP-diacylglycerol--serine O-phosphatidyltransferase
MMIQRRKRQREHARDRASRRGMRRAVVLMPNGLTLFNLMCGIYAIILALRGEISSAPGFIVLGGIADTLDGRVARATGTGSPFGEELDSLTDAISFGLAPALIMYMGLPSLNRGNLDWVFVFIFTACAVMRLARFNVEQAGRKKTHFHGLPSPAAGLTLATYYWFSQTPLYNQTVILFTDSKTLADLPWHTILRGLTAMLAALMISDVPYPAVPSIGFNSLKKIFGTLVVITGVVLLLVRREEFIFPALLAYVLFGVVKWLIIGFLGRSTTPDEIFWEREAELHRPRLDHRDRFDEPALAIDDDIAIDDDVEPADDEAAAASTAAGDAAAGVEAAPGARPPRRPRGDRSDRSDRSERGERGERAERREAREGREGRRERQPASDDPNAPARRRRRRRGGRGTRPPGSIPPGPTLPDSPTGPAE